MQVICHYRNDPERGLTDPLPELGGRKFIFRLYSGDICDPTDGGQWFGPEFPKKVWRTYVSKPILPFISFKWPFTQRACYIGFKLYGADPEVYKQWMNPEDVYQGSQALCFSFRPFANLINEK